MKKRTKILSFLLVGVTALGMMAFANTISIMSIRGDGTSIALSKSNIVIQSSTATTTKKVYDVTISNGSTTSSVQAPDGVTPTPPVETTVYATVIDGPLNVRSGPSMGYSVIGVLNIGDKVEAVAKNNGWIKIKYGTNVAYISASYVALSGNLEEEVIPPSSNTIKKVIIDPGHGGSDPGAIGPSAYQEKAFTLSTSMKLKNQLDAKGYATQLTRSTDIYLSLQERVDISNKSGADLFVSIHANSFNESSKGVETFSYQATGMAADVAKLVQARLVANTGLTNRGPKQEAYYVLKYNNVPAILVEAAFISNPTEEALLKTSAFQDKVAKSIVEGIEQYK